MNNLKVHWLNGLLAICLAGASAFAMNWRDWHPGVWVGPSSGSACWRSVPP